MPDILNPPPVTPEPGWVPVNPFPEVATSRSFVSGYPEGGALRVSYFRREADNVLVGRAWFGIGSEGPPGHAHGGSVAAVLDEAMGGAAWLAGHTAVAARLAVDFKQMVALGVDATFEAWVDQVDGRKVLTRSRLLDGSGGVLAEGEALFIVIEPERFAEFLANARR